MDSDAYADANPHLFCLPPTRRAQIPQNFLDALVRDQSHSSNLRTLSADSSPDDIIGRIEKLNNDVQFIVQAEQASDVQGQVGHPATHCVHQHCFLASASLRPHPHPVVPSMMSRIFLSLALQTSNARTSLHLQVHSVSITGLVRISLWAHFLEPHS